MSKDKNDFKLFGLSPAEIKIQRIRFLNCQVVGCQKKFDLAAQQFVSAQAIMAEARDQLEAARQALEKVAMEFCIDDPAAALISQPLADPFPPAESVS